MIMIRTTYLLLLVFMVGCAASRTTILSSETYDTEKQLTTLTIIPYGNIEINGEWKKTKYNEVSRQHFFEDTALNSIAIALNPMSEYPFYKTGMTEPQFVKDFFNWEKEYYEKQNVDISELKSTENYVLWEVVGENIHTNFLYGAKNGNAYNFAVFESKMGEEGTQEFLINLFENN